MIRLILQRVDEGDEGTFGYLTLEDKVFHTGELPDRGNQPDISRINAGVYECSWTFSPKMKVCHYLLNDVPGHFGVRIHAGNFAGDRLKGLKCDIEGCIVLGVAVGDLGGQMAIISSKAALTAFEELMAEQPFELEIRDINKEATA